MNIKLTGIVLLTLTTILFNCSNRPTKEVDHAQLHYQQIAWKALSEQEKLSITMEWKNARVEETIYENKKAYSVVFHTIDDALLGPLVILIDQNSNHVVAKRFNG